MGDLRENSLYNSIIEVGGYHLDINTVEWIESTANDVITGLETRAHLVNCPEESNQLEKFAAGRSFVLLKEEKKFDKHSNFYKNREDLQKDAEGFHKTYIEKIKNMPHDDLYYYIYTAAVDTILWAESIKRQEEREMQENSAEQASHQFSN